MPEHLDDPEHRAPQDSDTLPVPPPSFRERLHAAQRARALEARRSTQITVPPAEITEIIQPKAESPADKSAAD